MRKFYSLIAFAALGLVSLTANAQFTVPEENEVLQSEDYNYRLYKNVDFNGKTINGEAIEGDITFDTSVTTEEFKFNGYVPYRCVTDGLTNLWQSVGNIAWADGYGLRNTGSGPRGLHIASLKKGQILVLQGRNGGYNTAQTDADYNAFCIPNGFRYSSSTGWAWEYTDPLIVENISDEIHAYQDSIAKLNSDEPEAEPADEGEGEEGEDEEATEETPAHDHYLYLRVLEDGVLNLPLERSAGILGFQIWIDATAEEAVTAPSMKIVKVDGPNRELEFKPGESTFGNEVTTYYTIDGTEPIYMKDSEEVDHIDYVYLTDAEGNYVLDADSNKIVLQETVVYKRVVDYDLIAEYGDAGDNEYTGDGTLTIHAEDDEDGDGYVEVQAASVTSTGIISEIVSVKIAVGDITLNAPTLTLQGFDGKERTYMIGWNNNTICKETDYKFVVEGAAGSTDDIYTEDLGVGDVFSFSDAVTVTVKLDGYLDGVLTYEADYKGQNIRRKAAETEDEEGNPIHDWDFTNLTLEQQQIVRGEVIESYYIKNEDGDSIVCSYADYMANDGVVNGIDFTEGTANYAPTCWWWDGSRTRATLNVDTLGNNRNSNNFGYVEDIANIFPDMLINCPPNASNNSCIFIYINGDLGAYFMSRPSFTFPRSRVAAGELLLIYTGSGGSNWTSVRGPEIFEAPADDLLKVSGLRFASGTHIFYMDVYTYDNLPEDLLEDANEAYEEATSVKEVSASAKAVAGYYTIAGAKLAAPQKGINIVKFADGSAAKILVK